MQPFSLIAGLSPIPLAWLGRFGLDLDFVETIAKHSAGERLTHKGIRIDALNDAEDDVGFAFLGQHHEHFAFLLGVPPRAVEHRHPTMELVDGRGDVVVALREDEELHRLPPLIDHKVEHSRDDDERGVAIEEILQIAVGQEERGAHDDNVADEHHRAERDVAVLVDHGCDDVRAARRSIAQKHKSHAHAHHTGGKDATHEGIANDDRELDVGIEAGRKQRGIGGVEVLHPPLHAGEQEGEHEHGKNRLHAEAQRERAERHNEEEGVGQKEGVLHLPPAGGVENNGAQTGGAAGGDFMRQQEEREAHGIAQQSERDEQIVLGFEPEIEFEMWRHGMVRGEFALFTNGKGQT